MPLTLSYTTRNHRELCVCENSPCSDERFAIQSKLHHEMVRAFMRGCVLGVAHVVSTIELKRRYAPDASSVLPRKTSRVNGPTRDSSFPNHFPQ